MKLWVANKNGVKLAAGSLAELKNNMLGAGDGAYDACLCDVETDKGVFVDLYNGKKPSETNPTHSATYTVSGDKLRQKRSGGETSTLTPE